MCQMRRTWGATVQKIVGARQLWRCAKCDCLLPSAYEVDHVQPLWDGGKDCHETNAQALCPTCHASKTQLERIDRRKKLEAARLKAVELALAEASTNDADETAPTFAAHKPRAKKAAMPPLCPETDPFFTNNNPFLRYAYVRGGKVGGGGCV